MRNESDARGLAATAHIVGEALRDDETFTLQVPTDGSVQSLRILLDRLNDAAIPVHTADLDDVFLALTSHPETQKGTVR